MEENLRALQVLADLGIFVQMGFIMFDPLATVDDISANQRFLADVKAMFPEDKLGYLSPTTKLIPLSGSEYMERLKEAGQLKGNYLDYTYDFADKKQRCSITYHQNRQVCCGGPRSFSKTKAAMRKVSPRTGEKRRGNNKGALGFNQLLGYFVYYILNRGHFVHPVHIVPCKGKPLLQISPLRVY